MLMQSTLGAHRSVVSFVTNCDISCVVAQGDLGAGSDGERSMRSAVALCLVHTSAPRAQLPKKRTNEPYVRCGRR
eukprot:3286054-Amphidinium_carterae.2